MSAIQTRKLAFQRVMDEFFGGLASFLLYIQRVFLKKKRTSNQIKTITIIKLSGIGDAVLILPLIKEIKKQKKAKIRIICGKENYPIFEGQKDINAVEIVDISSRNILKNILEVIRLSKNKTDYGIDAGQSSFFSTIVNRISSKRTSGFYNKKMGFFRNGLIDDKINNINDEHMIFNFLNLAEKIGIRYKKDKIKLIEPEYSNKDFGKIKNLIGIGKQKVIGLHPCSVFDYKEWPRENFAEVIRFLLKNYKEKVVIAGSPSEAEKAEKLIEIFSESEREKIINLTGKTSIKEFIAICTKFRIFIANDGGLMHIAAAMNVPTIGIFGYEHPKRYSPFNNKSASFYKGPSESQCFLNQYSHANIDCKSFKIGDIKVREVINKANKILKQ